MRRTIVPGLGRWAATIVATVASTYALDIVATAAGVLLTGSRLLARADVTTALLVLLASYLAWGFGLRANLRANLALLRMTGTSTNVVSKGLFDLAQRLDAPARLVVAAAAFGYLVTELAKELPYYVGAIGLAFLHDAVTVSDALAFLTGANLGAAAYEFVLAAGTRAMLARRHGRLIAGSGGHPAFDRPG